MNHKLTPVSLIGYACGRAGADKRASDGPLVLEKSPYFANFENIKISWNAMLTPDLTKPTLEAITEICNKLARITQSHVEKNQLFTVLGGDHSSAIGTWSGVQNALRSKGDLGLIWVDAHMDSHTPSTSHSGNIHGMPLAALLGQGDASLTQILNSEPKLKPENVCLIGIRSFESEEEDLLKKLNVRVFYMKEIHERGLDNVMQDALKIVTQNTTAFGISIDIDSIDPTDAPGTGVVEPDGLSAKDLVSALTHMANDTRFIGAEIVEFNPAFDHQNKTEKLIPDLLNAICAQ